MPLALMVWWAWSARVLAGGAGVGEVDAVAVVFDGPDGDLVGA
jgi:hypothetical protein